MHSFTISSCFRGIFWLIRHFGHILSGILIPFVLPMCAATMLAGTTMVSMSALAWIDAGMPASWLIYTAIMLVFGALAVAACLFTSHVVWNGGRPKTGEILVVARQALPVILIYNLGTMIITELVLAGSFLLIAIGVIGLICWSVVLFPIHAVAVLERHSVRGSFVRAAAISSGYRWRISALIVLISLSMGVLGAVVGAGLGYVISAAGWSINELILAVKIFVIVSTAILSPTAQYVAYTLILADRGEIGPSQTADLFS